MHHHVTQLVLYSRQFVVMFENDIELYKVLFTLIVISLEFSFPLHFTHAKVEANTS